MMRVISGAAYVCDWYFLHNFTGGWLLRGTVAHRPPRRRLARPFHPGRRGGRARSRGLAAHIIAQGPRRQVRLPAIAAGCDQTGLEGRRPDLKHDPEKWIPVFRKRSCYNKALKREDDPKKSHPALERQFC